MLYPRRSTLRRMILIMAVLPTILGQSVLFAQTESDVNMDTAVTSIYDFKATDIYGDEQDLNQYEGKVVLIVNTASECGFTPQFEGLERIYNDYKDQGFVVLGFPCNQFGGQEPGDEESIVQGCMVNYGVTFPMFSKVDVNGKDAHPLFNYLKDQLSGFAGKRIKWNFTKFLIDRNGIPVKRFGSMDKPEKIEQLLGEYL